MEVVVEMSSGEKIYVVIAEELDMSRETLKNHVSHIYHKLGVHSRAGMVIRAYEEGWVTPRKDM